MNRSKNTKRFSFRISTNDKSHQAGANTVSIAVKDYVSPGQKGYATPVGDVSPGQTVTMTVKEAKAFQKFLNTYFTPPSV